MDRAALRRLAVNTVVDGAVCEPVARFALDRLGRPELKEYARLLRAHVDRERLTLVCASEPRPVVLSALERLYPGRRVTVAIDPALGAGLRIIDGSDVIDMNVRSMIERSLEMI